MVSKHKVLLALVVIVFAALAGILLPRWISNAVSNGRSGVEPEHLDYEVLTSVAYEGPSGVFASQSAGVLSVDRKPTSDGDASYTYSFKTYVDPGAGEKAAELSCPPAILIRDPRTERLVGGNDIMKNFSAVANMALAQIESKLPTDGTTAIRSFEFSLSEDFPRRLTYNVTAAQQSLAARNDAVAVLATSEPFQFTDPASGGQVAATHRMLCVMGPELKDLLYSCSVFTATTREGAADAELRLTVLSYRLQDGKPVPLSGLDQRFNAFLDQLELSSDAALGESNTGLPPWAMHSLAARDMADLTASAAIEGRPNFAICAAIGSILIVDSGVSVATGLLHDIGVIDWEWQGLPNYLGQGVGLGAARVYEDLTGSVVDKERWKSLAGTAADLASMFIPSKAMIGSVKYGRDAAQVITVVQRTRKTIDLARQAGDEAARVRAVAERLQREEAQRRLAEAERARAAAERRRREEARRQQEADKRREETERARAAAERRRRREEARRQQEAEKRKREEAQGHVGPALPRGWTSEKRSVKVATPKGEQWKEITYYKNTIGLEFVLVPAGEFMMGSPAREAERASDEGPQHRVRVTKPFYMGAWEVTQAEYERLMRKNPAHFKGASNPVEMVSWNDAVEFCRRLSQKEGLTYRLPSEAEWEYACRAGTTTPFYTGETISTELANYNGNSTYGRGKKGVYRKKTTPVGSFAANSLGLYDMHGNVWEWCQSLYEPYPYRDDDGRENLRATGARVLRGGSWSSNPSRCRSADRRRTNPTRTYGPDGFRVVLLAE